MIKYAVSRSKRAVSDYSKRKKVTCIGVTMEFIAKKLTDYILEKNVIEEENYDIYKFGFEYFFYTAFSFISAMIIAFFI